MMIGVQGQYLFIFNLGDNTDFIEEGDLVQFSITEEAGNLLPTFNLLFYSSDESIFYTLNESNILNVSFGRDNNSLVTMPLSIATLGSSPSGASKRLISVNGLFNAIPYLNNPKINITSVQSGIEAIIATASKSFKVQSNITSSSDSQAWIQHNLSDKNFIDAIWLHCNVLNSFPAIGISSLGYFVIKDIKKDLLNPFKYRFTQNPVLPNDIPYDADPVFVANTGFMNNWVGYGRQKIVYDVDDPSNDSIALTKPQPVTALTANLARNQDVSYIFDSIGIVNENTDPNYWSTFQHNLAYLGMYGTISTTLSFQSIFVPIQVLDQVNFKNQSVDTTYSQTTEYNTGIYYVNKISRNLGKRQFVTVVSICRESNNNIKISQ
jgi:hypothetical protein